MEATLSGAPDETPSHHDESLVFVLSQKLFADLTRGKFKHQQPVMTCADIQLLRLLAIDSEKTITPQSNCDVELTDTTLYCKVKGYCFHYSCDLATFMVLVFSLCVLIFLFVLLASVSESAAYILVFSVWIMMFYAR